MHMPQDAVWAHTFYMKTYIHQNTKSLTSITIKRSLWNPQLHIALYLNNNNSNTNKISRLIPALVSKTSSISSYKERQGLNYISVGQERGNIVIASYTYSSFLPFSKHFHCHCSHVLYLGRN